jgi:hypothetical protein
VKAISSPGVHSWCQEESEPIIVGNIFLNASFSEIYSSPPILYICKIKLTSSLKYTYLKLEPPCATITSIGLCEAIGGWIDVGLSQEVSRQRIVAPKI